MIDPNTCPKAIVNEHGTQYVSYPICITIPGVPLPWKAPYVGTKGCFSVRTEPGKIIKNIIRSQYDGDLITGHINCQLTFFMPIPKSTSKKKRLRMLCGMDRPEAGGDRTNLCKWYEDLMQGIVYVNDKQIVGGEPSKYYGEEPRVEIRIWKL